MKNFYFYFDIKVCTLQLADFWAVDTSLETIELSLSIAKYNHCCNDSIFLLEDIFMIEKRPDAFRQTEI